jgi:hypothetical protein
VTSYVLLGRDRLEGFMMDFNSLVRNVNGALGMMRIQVFPVVLVVRKGMDKGGRELIWDVSEWIRWFGEVTGR